MQFIHGTTLVYLKIRSWGGEKKASRDSDIQIGTNGKMPPKKLLDLGRKKIFPPSAFDPLLNRRKAAERACLENGTRFMGGYAIPDELVDGLIPKLEDIKQGFESALHVFLSDFDRNKQNWIDENQEFAHIIHNQVPDREVVEKSFGFDFWIYKMQPLVGHGPDEQDIADQVLHEVSLTCKGMSDRMMERKRSIRGENLADQLIPTINKLNVLSFGNGRIIKVQDEFQRMLTAIPLTEMIDKDHPVYGQLLTFLSMCSDSVKLEQIIEGDFSVSKLIEGMKRTTEDHSCDPVTTQPSQPVPTRTISVGAYF